MTARHAFIAVSALFLLGTAAQAETYEGVAPSVSANARADVVGQAVQAAATPGQNIPAGSRVLVNTSNADRAAVRADAVRAAAAPDQNVSAGSRVNSQVVSTMPRRDDASSVQAATRM
jgi:hypothetical protein